MIYGYSGVCLLSVLLHSYIYKMYHAPNQKKWGNDHGACMHSEFRIWCILLRTLIFIRHPSLKSYISKIHQTNRRTPPDSLQRTAAARERFIAFGTGYHRLF